jgi:hypothetical protein
MGVVLDVRRDLVKLVLCWAGRACGGIEAMPRSVGLARLEERSEPYFTQGSWSLFGGRLDDDYSL